MLFSDVAFAILKTPATAEAVPPKRFTDNINAR